MEHLHIQRSTLLTNFTTWRIGGSAEYLAEPTSIQEVIELVQWSKKQKLELQTIGAGSNLLISDSGLKGLTICTRKLHGIKISTTTGVIQALAGESIPTLSRHAARSGLKGLEWAVGIPGTIGGATVMNAGAQGGCIADYLDSVQVMDLEKCHCIWLTRKELQYSYRKSLLQNKKYLVLCSKFILNPGHKYKELNKLTNENLVKRIETQPYQLPSCGSVFRNPEPLKAGALIEDVGLKGHRIGGAQISEIHANFIVNTDAATASDVLSLINIAQQKVLSVHGILLKPEVKKLGFESTRNL